MSGHGGALGPFVRSGGFMCPIDAAAGLRPPSAPARVLWLPQSFEGTSTVTRVRNILADVAHGTPSGSPARTTAGGQTALDLDGVNDRIDVTSGLSMLDECTLWMLLAPGVANAGDYAWFVELSDTGASDRSISAAQIYTSMGARDKGGDSTASYVFGSTSLALYRFTFKRRCRSIHRDGVWQASSAVYTSPTRTVDRLRAGLRFDGTKPGKGRIVALSLVEGTPTDYEIEHVEARLRGLVSIAAPYAYTDLPLVDAPADPRWLIDGITIDAVAGEPVEIFKDTVLLADGRTTMTATLSSGTFDRSPSDRWAFTPSSPGSLTMTITAGAHSATMTVNVVASLAGGAAKKYGWIFGDSRAHRAAGPGSWEMLAQELGASRWGAVGSLGPETGATVRHDGIDSTTTVYWTGASSPLNNGGASLDVPGFWAAHLTHTPDVVYIELIQNDWYTASSGNVTAAITTGVANLETLITAIQAANPSAKVFLSLGQPLATDPSAGLNANRFAFRTRAHQAAEALLAAFDDRGDEGIYLVHRTWLGCDGVRDYGPADAIHTVSSPGHERQLAAIRASLFAHGWS